MKKLGVIFGGMSTENKVSCISGASVIKNLNKEKYEIFPIFIDEDGNWYKINMPNHEKINIENRPKLENVFEYLKQMDVIFPVLHGLYGEDGTIQGLLELLNVPYVGINKVKNLNELKDAIVEAAIYDKKILIEEGIDGRELECAVLGNEDVEASCVGEIKAADEFYSYDAKYKNSESKTLIPADISNEKSEEIRKLAIKAFKAIDGKGLSRVDFFMEKDTEKVYINEINTLPGFTSISMYPKLFEKAGIKYADLLDKVIELSVK